MHLGETTTTGFTTGGQAAHEYENHVVNNPFLKPKLQLHLNPSRTQQARQPFSQHLDQQQAVPLMSNATFPLSEEVGTEVDVDVEVDVDDCSSASDSESSSDDEENVGRKFELASMIDVHFPSNARQSNDNYRRSSCGNALGSECGGVPLRTQWSMVLDDGMFTRQANFWNTHDLWRHLQRIDAIMSKLKRKGKKGSVRVFRTSADSSKAVWDADAELRDGSRALSSAKDDKGGKWVMRFSRKFTNDINTTWVWLALSLMSGAFPRCELVSGCVFSTKKGKCEIEVMMNDNPMLTPVNSAPLNDSESNLKCTTKQIAPSLSSSCSPQEPVPSQEEQESSIRSLCEVSAGDGNIQITFKSNRGEWKLRSYPNDHARVASVQQRKQKNGATWASMNMRVLHVQQRKQKNGATWTVARMASSGLPQSDESKLAEYKQQLQENPYEYVEKQASYQYHYDDVEADADADVGGDRGIGGGNDLLTPEVVGHNDDDDDDDDDDDYDDDDGDYDENRSLNEDENASSRSPCTSPSLPSKDCTPRKSNSPPLSALRTPSASALASHASKGALPLEELQELQMKDLMLSECDWASTYDHDENDNGPHEEETEENFVGFPLDLASLRTRLDSADVVPSHAESMFVYPTSITSTSSTGSITSASSTGSISGGNSSSCSSSSSITSAAVNGTFSSNLKSFSGSGTSPALTNVNVHVKSRSVDIPIDPDFERRTLYCNDSDEDSDEVHDLDDLDDLEQDVAGSLNIQPKSLARFYDFPLRNRSQSAYNLRSAQHQHSHWASTRSLASHGHYHLVPASGSPPTNLQMVLGTNPPDLSSPVMMAVLNF